MSRLDLRIRACVVNGLTNMQQTMHINCKREKFSKGICYLQLVFGSLIQERRKKCYTIVRIIHK